MSDRKAREEAAVKLRDNAQEWPRLRYARPTVRSCLVIVEVDAAAAYVG